MFCTERFSYSISPLLNVLQSASKDCHPSEPPVRQFQNQSPTLRSRVRSSMLNGVKLKCMTIGAGGWFPAKQMRRSLYLPTKTLWNTFLSLWFPFTLVLTCIVPIIPSLVCLQAFSRTLKEALECGRLGLASNFCECLFSGLGKSISCSECLPICKVWTVFLGIRGDNGIGTAQRLDLGTLDWHTLTSYSKLSPTPCSWRERTGISMRLCPSRAHTCPSLQQCL